MGESKRRAEPVPPPPTVSVPTEGPGDVRQPAGRDPFARRVLVAVLIGLALLLLALFVWYAMYVLLLAFAGVLVGVLLRALSDLVSRWTRLGHGWSLGIVIVVLAGATVAVAWLTASRVAAEVDKVNDRLPETVRKLEDRLARYGWGRQLLNRPGPGPGHPPGGPLGAADAGGGLGDAAADAPGSGAVATVAAVGQTAAAAVPPTPAAGAASSQPASQPTSRPAGTTGGLREIGTKMITGDQAGSVLATARRALGGFFNAAVAVLVVLVVGIYMAATPGLYIRGFLHLIPKAARPRVRDTLYAIGHSLRWWLIGQGITMVVIGVLTAVGLWLIGVDLWLAFGVLAAVFNFIPNFGPLISFTPAFFFALADSPTKALWVAALYAVAQSFEGYVLTPLVQRKAIDMPPAVLILSQVLMGLLAGPIGVVLAAPLTAAALVAVQRLYVRDTLGDPVPAAEEDKEAGGKEEKAVTGGETV